MSAVPELASTYGGDIATLSDAQRKLHPEQAVYRVLLRLPTAAAASVRFYPVRW